jgi:hypothetical protein
VLQSGAMILSAVDVVISMGIVAAVLGLQLVATIDDPPGGADEGYLWYGVLEVARGKVPLRDFRSYEPGRYWVSLPFLLLGRGLPSVRVAATAMLGLGALALALVVRGAGGGWSVVAVSVVVVAAWSPIFQKRHDQAVLLFAAAAMAWVSADPSPTSFLTAGIVVGLALVFGVNLGLYAGVAAGLTLLVVARRSGTDLVPSAGWVSLGVVAGASPLWSATVVVRGFGRALWERRVVDTTRRRSTNLALPIPVPWRRPRRQVALVVGPTGRGLAPVLFVVVPVAAAVVVLTALFGPQDWAGENPVPVGAAALTVPAWHHVMSRADVEHLSSVVAVPLVGLLTFADVGVVPLGVTIAAIVMVTGAVSVPRHPRVQRRREPGAFVRRSVLGRRALWFRVVDAALISAALEVREKEIGDEPWLAVPMTLWVLPFVGRRSAVYDCFCVYPASESVEYLMITEIEAAAPPIAIVGLGALDGREDLRFPATHPRVWSHLCDAYETAAVDVVLPPSLVVLRRRGGADQGAYPVSS